MGDVLGWSYEQATAEMQQVFEWTMQAFYERNFSGHALANRLQSTRFDVEIARHFHRELFAQQWLQRAKALSMRLASSSAAAVREISERVREGCGRRGSDEEFVAAISAELRTQEAEIDKMASALEREVSTAVGARCDHAPI